MSATIVKFDPLVALHCRWNALHAECGRLLDEGQGTAADAVRQWMVEVEDRIAALVPRHLLVPLCRFDFLQHVYSAFESREPHDENAAKLICGLQQIGEAQP